MDRGSDPYTRYEFGRFRLDVPQRLLTIADGEAIPLNAKAFDTLLYFVAHHGALLDSATLTRQIWPNLVVEDSNLRQQISRLRRALGDGQEGQRYIVTVPGRGYQFVAPVRASLSLTSSSANEEWVLAQTQGGRTLPQSGQPARKSSNVRFASIAVLPFGNLTGNAEKEYFSDGLADELINKLTRVSGLKVVARTSSFAYRGHNADVREISRALEVAMLLEGSVRSAGERIRVTAQLVDGAAGYHLWSQTYDRPFTDLFALEDELVGAIVQAINAYVDGSFAAEATPSPPTRDLEAYELYLQGRSIQFRLQVADLRGARELFQRAIERDPAFARAFSAMALTRWAEVGLVPAASLRDAEQDAERALALDGTLAEAEAILANAHAMRGQFVAAEERYRKVFGARHVEAIARADHAAYVLASAGQLRKALHEVEGAYRQEPTNSAVAALFATLSSHRGLDSEAVKYADLAVRLGWLKDFGPVQYVYGCAALRAGNFAEAGHCAARSLPANLDAEIRASVAFGYLTVGNSAGLPLAVVSLRQVLRSVPPQEMDPYLGIHLILCFTLLGEVGLAFECGHKWLASYMRDDMVGTRWGTLWVPEMRAFRRHAEFQPFLRRLGLMEYWEQYGAPDECEMRDGQLIVL